MNNINAIVTGGLAGKPAFFGSSTAEIISNTNVNASSYPIGGWNGDYALSVYSSSPWARPGGASNSGANAGSFAFFRGTGGVYNTTSHRTILSGY